MKNGKNRKMGFEDSHLILDEIEDTRELCIDPNVESICLLMIVNRKLIVLLS